VLYKNLDRSFFRFVTMHAFDRKTDRQTDRQTEFSSLDRVCIIFIPSPTTWIIGRNWPTRFKNADIQSIFARGASAEKKQRSIITSANVCYFS